jgi:putative SOS response-associated peptidase YedK
VGSISIDLKKSILASSELAAFSHSKGRNRTLNRAVLITGGANELVAQIHDHMSLDLPKQALSA